MYLHRYLRVTPVLAATIFMFLTLQRYFGDGPFNKRTIALQSPGCLEYWFAALLHIQNLVNPDRICLAHTWYLSTDFQLFVLSPLLVFPLWKYGPKFFTTLPVLALSSAIFIFMISYENGIKVIPLFK